MGENFHQKMAVFVKTSFGLLVRGHEQDLNSSPNICVILTDESETKVASYYL